MRWIGTLKHMQVQGERIKDRQADEYDPHRIVRAASLELSLDGAVGITVTGDRLQDVHHNQHPNSHSRGDNTLSVCFTSHYERARAHFGTALPDGCMGENLLVASDEEFHPGLPGRALVFQHEETCRAHPHRAHPRSASLPTLQQLRERRRVRRLVSGSTPLLE